MNEQIRASKARLVSADGNVLGVVPIRDAQRFALDAGLDPVEVASNVRPPVCRIMDYHKFKELQEKKAHAGRPFPPGTDFRRG